MKVIGLDLSGPSNIADTHLVIFDEQGSELHLMNGISGADDQQIFHTVSVLEKNEPIAIGIDAPLSYNSGGGDRPSDAALRRMVHTKGGGVGVLPPTMMRMAYLTLRGIVLARMLETLKPELDLRIVEVHPGASMLLRGAPAKAVAAFKRDGTARFQLLQWLAAQGLVGISRTEDVADHYVAACAAALGAWQWSFGKSAWLYSASPPEHPYDFAC
jgi:predicted nuclease with RNAse H fold